MELKKVPKSLRKKNGTPDGKKAIITLTEAAEKSFHKLRDILCSDLVLALRDFEKKIVEHLHLYLYDKRFAIYTVNGQNIEKI